MGPQHIMFFVCLPITFLCLFGFCRKDGIWGTLIKAFCLFFAMMFTLNFFEPVANKLDQMFPQCAYYNDTWAFLLIFAPSLTFQILITNRLSRVNVAFAARPNFIGSMIILCLIFVGFYGVGAQICSYLIPEAPLYTSVPGVLNNPIQFRLVEMMSGGALAPMSGGNRFQYNDFYIGQLKKNAAVYSAVTSGGSSTSKAKWAFQGTTSPNVGP